MVRQKVSVIAGRVRKWKPKHGRWKLMAKRKYLYARQPIQFFKRCNYQESAVTIPGGAPPAVRNFAYEFALSNVPNYTEFSNLYDAYKIMAVKLEFIPRHTEAVMEPPSLSTTLNSSIHSVLDYDDANTLTALNDYVQYESYKNTRGNRTHKRYLVPAMEQSASALGVNTLAVQAKRKWLDTDVPQVAHYGVKVYFEPANVTTVYDIKTTYYLAFKQVK